MTLLYIEVLIIHFIADFVLQSNWMAQGKSKETLPLMLHCGTYFFTFWFFLSLCVPRYELIDVFFYSWVNTILHFCIDYVTSRINSYLWVKGNVHNFFVGISSDQLLHQICLISTAYWIFSA